MDRPDARKPRPNADGESYDLDRRVLWLLYALGLAVALVPVFATPLLPLVDLPNHLARVHILDHLDSEPALQKYYDTDWHLLAFQSHDFLLPPLARLLGLFPAAQVYTAVALLLMFAGTVALHRALFGRFGLLPVAGVLFLYNLLLAWGFVSYLLSAGLAMLLLAGWIATEGRAPALRVLAFSAGIFILLLCHFFTFAAYAVLIVAYELGRILQDRPLEPRRAFLRLMQAGLPFLPACAAVLASYQAQALSLTEYGSFAERARALMSPTIMYMTWSDLAVTYAVIFGFWYYWRGRRLRFSPRMRLPLLAMLVTGALMPLWLLSVWGASFRIPILLVFLGIAAFDLRLARRRQVALFVAGVFALLLIRVADMTQLWHHYASDYREFLDATAVIDNGSRVLALPPVDTDGSWSRPQIFPYFQLATLTVVERDVLVPTLFSLATPLTMPGLKRGFRENLQDSQHPLVWNPTDSRFVPANPETVRAVEALGESGLRLGSYFSPVDWSRWPEDYDYLIVFTFGRDANPVPELLTPVATGSFFTIFRIHPPHAQ